MIIQCTDCKKKIDLCTKILIEHYLNGGTIKCPYCKYENQFEKENKDERI